MNGRTTMTLAVLAAGLAATGSWHDAVDALLPVAHGQQPGESAQPADRERETRGRDDESTETEIARAGASADEMYVTGLQVERSEHGPHVTDQDGRALYLLESENNGESECYEQCAEEWPPALIEQGQPPEAGGRVDENLLGTFERADGGVQITYGDYPLYYYYRDEEPGDVTGHDVHDDWGEWYLVTPEGEPLESEEAESGQAEGDERG